MVSPVFCVQKTRVTYVDHDRTEIDSDDDSHLAWPGYGKARHHAVGKKSSRSLISAETVRSQYDSPAGPYDSPHSDLPGPYDSPESDIENDETPSEQVLTRFVLFLYV